MDALGWLFRRSDTVHLVYRKELEVLIVRTLEKGEM